METKAVFSWKLGCFLLKLDVTNFLLMSIRREDDFFMLNRYRLFMWALGKAFEQVTSYLL